MAAGARELAAARERADRLLVARGLFESRSGAQAAIAAGLVRADGVPVAKPSDRLAVDAELAAERPHPWVSRGGVKLAAALDEFAIDPAGLDCLDVGASTGGFTDVLLARGAARVLAVDVGQNQLHPRLAAEPRVVSLERTDARSLATLVPADSFDLVTVDVSFISLAKVFPHLTPLLRRAGQVVALVKPQFEVGPNGLGRGGIVRSEGLRERAAADAVAFATGLGFRVDGPIPSPIDGGDGNREYLLAARLA